MYRAAFFDFDGVVIDSTPVASLAFREAYRRVVGAGVAPVERFLSFSGDSFERIMDRLGLPRGLYAHFREVSRANLHMVELVPGMRAIIDRLRRAGFATALITGKDNERTLEILERFSIRAEFDAVFCGDTVDKPKPNPEGVRRALSACGVQQGEAVMIGDALSDVVAAKRAGVASIGVTWGVGSREHFAALETEYIIDRPEQILPILLQDAS